MNATRRNAVGSMFFAALSACTVERVDVGPVSTNTGMEDPIGAVTSGGATSGTVTSGGATSGAVTSGASLDSDVTCIAFNDAGDVRDLPCDALDRAVGAGFCVQYYIAGAAGRVVCPAETSSASSTNTCVPSGKDSVTCGETNTTATAPNDGLCTNDYGQWVSSPCPAASGSTWETTSPPPGSTSTYASTTVDPVTDTGTHGTTSPAESTSGASTGPVSGEPCGRAPRKDGDATGPCTEDEGGTTTARDDERTSTADDDAGVAGAIRDGRTPTEPDAGLPDGMNSVTGDDGSTDDR